MGGRLGSPVTPPKRHQSQTDRDLAGIAAKKEREAVVEDFVIEESSQAYDDPDARKAFRAKRQTNERISRLEEKHDELSAVVGDMRATLGRVDGKLDILPQLVSTLQADKQDALDDRKHKRERLTKIVGGIFSAGVLGAILHAVMS